MTSLDRFIPSPRLREIDQVEVNCRIDRAWIAVRHVDMARSAIVRGLFALRTLPERLRGRTGAAQSLRIDDITANADGFRILDERPGESITVGAIGKVWQLNIPFLQIPPDRFADFDEPGWVKVAWELRCKAIGDAVTRIAVEVRVSATDDGSWRRFERYFLLIGPFSRFIRRHTLGTIARGLTFLDRTSDTARLGRRR
jgi:hypothetical protein